MLVHVTVTNIGDQAQMFDGSSQKLVDTAGREHFADTSAAIYLGDANSFLTDINPGNSVEGTVVFDAPADAVPAGDAARFLLLRWGRVARLTAGACLPGPSRRAGATDGHGPALAAPPRTPHPDAGGRGARRCASTAREVVGDQARPGLVDLERAALVVVAVPVTSVQLGVPVIRNCPDHVVVSVIVTRSAGWSYVCATVWCGYAAPGSVVVTGPLPSS